MPAACAEKTPPPTLLTILSTTAPWCRGTRANADNDINNMLNAMMQGGGAENDRRCKKGSTDFGGFDDPATVQRLAHHNVTDDGEKVFFMHIYEAGCRMECTAELPLVADGECHRGGAFPSWLLARLSRAPIDAPSR